MLKRSKYKVQLDKTSKSTSTSERKGLSSESENTINIGHESISMNTYNSKSTMLQVDDDVSRRSTPTIDSNGSPSQIKRTSKISSPLKIPQSPFKRRMTRKLQKDQFRNMLGFDALPDSNASFRAKNVQKKRYSTTITTATTAAENDFPNSHTNDDSVDSSQKFWSSRFWIMIYVTLLSSLVLREPVFLHGISITVAYHIMDRIWVWGIYIFGSSELRKAIKNVEWMVKFSLSTVSKAVEGNRFHGFLTSKTFSFWTVGTGKSMTLTFLRQQLSDNRTRTMNEIRERLQSSEALRSRLKKSRS